MLMTMLRSSVAILLRPSVTTFEAHERNSLRWALAYVSLGALLTALLGIASFYLHRPFMGTQLDAIAAEFANFGQAIGQDLPIAEFMFPAETHTPLLSNALGTLIGFMTYLTIVFLLGKALGGSGTYGELAYDVALFWVPISVVSATLNVFSISLFSCLTAPVVVFVSFYGFYLTFLSVQAGLNLPPMRALVVVLVPAMLFLTFLCGLLALAFLVISQVPG
ncbi:MAG: hypothetical protein EOM24_19275 [Chloroflexia bacterium]|nr:hypothetical protein [Chloroflexia bacterium]